jgi:hypothetical protein
LTKIILKKKNTKTKRIKKQKIKEEDNFGKKKYVKPKKREKKTKTNVGEKKGK